MMGRIINFKGYLESLDIKVNIENTSNGINQNTNNIVNNNVSNVSTENTNKNLQSDTPIYSNIPFNFST